MVSVNTGTEFPGAKCFSDIATQQLKVNQFAYKVGLFSSQCSGLKESEPFITLSHKHVTEIYAPPSKFRGGLPHA